MKKFRLRFSRLVIFVLAWELSPMSAHAQWSTNPNVNNAICTAVNEQSAPTIVSDGAGGAIITWQDLRGKPSAIFAQRINASGVVQWAVDGVVISDTAMGQSAPTITSDGAGGAIITWIDYRTGTFGSWDIFAQHISSSGAVRWIGNGVPVCTAAQFQFYPSIVSDGVRGAIITWYDLRNGPTYDIYAQRVNTSGAMHRVTEWTANGVAISTATNDQRSPTIVSDSAGGAVITWMDYRNSTAENYTPDIYSQRINAAGAVQWTANGVAICTATKDQYNPTSVSDGAGGAIITWEDYRDGTGYTDIYAQRINAAGAVQWTANGVAICTEAQYQRAPTIVSDGAGGAIITWEDLRSGTGSDIYAQRINGAGAVQWTANGVAVCRESQNQYTPTIVGDGVGGAIITWEDWRGGNGDIYAQRINASGAAQWTANGVAISTAASHQYAPIISRDGARGAIITWKDYRNSGTNYDIYAQQVSANGQLGVVTGVGNDVAALPESFRLEQNYPNPFNPATIINYQLPVKGWVSLKVYDLLGREVATLVNGVEEPGNKSVQWDAGGVASGVYFYRLTSGDFVQTKQLLLLR